MRHNYLKEALLALLISFSSPGLAQVPVIPGAFGFGIDTPAGRGGNVMRVTNLNFDGNGSLKACIDASGPRVCIFEVSGAIDLGGVDITLRNPNITIAGQTAPSPGITLRNGGLKVAGSDVLIQHIAIRVGDQSGIEKPSNADALKVETGKGLAENVVIDHVSVSWAIDENFSSYAGADNVTVRNSIISEGLHDSMHQDGSHSKGIVIGENTGRISMIGNLIANNAERNPKSQTKDFVFANNVVYNFVTGGTSSAIPQNGNAIYHSIVGNLYIDGPDGSGRTPIGIRSYSDSPSFSTEIYLANNSWKDHSTDDQWKLASVQLPFSPKVDDAPVWPQSLQVISALSDNGESLLDLVLDNAGARPADRDSVDGRVVSGVRNRSGRIINCVSADGSERCSKNAGGWPHYAENRRALTLPANPNGDADGDGYTNLEEWLHQLAAEVEVGGKANDGDAVARPLPPELVSTR